MLKRLPVYLALAMLAASCGERKEDQDAAIDKAAAAAAEGQTAAAAVDAGAAVAADRGKALFAACAACHGASGEGNLALKAPGIAGQSESYLRRQLWEFKNGLRGSHVGDIAGAQMQPMAASLADGEEITAVAAYIAALPATVPPVTVDGDADNGEKLYISKCGACHGGKGWGNEALFTPRLTMLGDAYVVRQVTKFQDGMRGDYKDATYGKQMAMVAKTVSEEELNDIAAFLNELAAEE